MLPLSAFRRAAGRVILAVVAFVSVDAARGQCTPALDVGPQFPFQEPGSNDQVFASTTWDPDGTGYQLPRLVVGGLFTSIGGTPANHIAAWNGSRWEQLGQGPGGGFNSVVYAVKEFNGELYAAGAFTSANGVTINHVAKYNPATTAWTQVGSGFNGDVRALEVHQNELFAGGFFTTSGATTVNFVSRLSGSTWVALSGGGVSGSVYCLNSSSGIGGPQLYVGGSFATAGTGGSLIQAHNVARWSSTRIWDPLGGGTDGIVTAIRGGALGGNFNNVFSTDGTPVASPKVAFFLCQSSTCGLWLSNVNYPGGQVYALYSDNTGTYAAGGGGTNLCYKYSGASWTPVGSGYTGSFFGFTLTSYENELVMGGLFPNMILGPGLHNIARFHNNAWDSLKPHVNGEVRAFAQYLSGVVAGGTMDESASDGSHTAGLISCDPSQNPVSGFAGWGIVNGPVSALFVGGNGITLPTLYAAGTFANAGNATNVNNIAAWSGAIGPGGPQANWAALGTGITSSTGTPQVLALAGYGLQGIGINRTPIVHAAGSFTNAGSNSCRNIAKYASGVWQPLAGGLSSTSGTETVKCLLNSNGLLYAGGIFDTANNPGAITANSVASWNGTAWSALGSGATAGLRNGGTKGTVDCLIAFGGGVVAGGLFDSAGGVSCRNVARWDGANWTDMGTGIPSISDEVVAFGILYSHLYCATDTAIGSSGGPEARVYRWEGSSWVQVGSGFGAGAIRVLAAVGNRLHAGGQFPFFPGANSSNWIEVLCTCRGDYNNDGQITPADVAAFINAWSTSVANGTLDGDFDGNGHVEPVDVAAFVNAWFAALTNGC